MTTGIYGIFDTRNGDCLYIGQSKNIQDRWRSHRKRLLAGKHLQGFTEWFQGQGSDISILELRVLETTDNTDEAKNVAEIRWFKKLSPTFYGQVPSINNSGWTQAEETKQRIADSLLGQHRPHTYVCAYCSSDFETRRKKRCSQTYCSSACYTDAVARKRLVDIEELRKLYYEERRNIRYISKLFGVGDNTILKVMKENGMTPRPRGNKASQQGAVTQSG